MLRTAPLLCAAVCCAVSPAWAAEAGDTIVQEGWLHIIPRSTSTPLETDLKPSLLGSLLGVQSHFTSPDTSARVGNSDTAVLILTHFFSPQLALQVVGGIPVHFRIYGQGVVAPTGLLGRFLNVDLGAPTNNPLVTVREWTPAMVLQYYFGPPAADWHPFVGIGVSYTWYSEITLNSGFQQQIDSQFGRLLALSSGKPGPTRASATASREWNGVFNAGLNYDLSRHWGFAAALSYAPLQTTAHILVKAADGTVLSDSRTHLSQNALVPSLLVNYRFHF